LAGVGINNRFHTMGRVVSSLPSLVDAPLALCGEHPITLRIHRITLWIHLLLKGEQTLYLGIAQPSFIPTAAFSSGDPIQ
jgi:hypothetical protein